LPAALQVWVLIIGRYAGVSHALIHGRIQDIDNLTTISTLMGGFHDGKLRHFRRNQARQVDIGW